MYKIVFLLVCKNEICAQGAQCIATTSGPTCKCLEGLIGNPFPGGQCTRDVCSKSTPCEEPYVCISGRCKQRCEGIICGVGAHCDPNSNKCVCDNMFVGNPNLLCMPRKLSFVKKFAISQKIFVSFVVS